MTPRVVAAIFKRNFVSYFSSPIGYVFICALVLLSAFAAFWPNDFFNANLANLDQLNRVLPWIMLVFIPAVTMSTWALERERGTDELLLTLPARDLDVVIGKYLAALAIFSVALLFSLFNVAVLLGLGRPDLGLIAANYVGYWVVGAAMISMGIVASFLTSNLTVAFILAVAFNAPLVFAAHADVILGRNLALAVKDFSIASRFTDFGRGVISLSAVAYFAGLAILMLYLCMVLIRRRHWAGGNRAPAMRLHYAVRGLSLLAMAAAVTLLASRFDRRVDATSEKLSSLSPRTRALLMSLSPDRPVYVDAYVSPEVPEEYVQARLNLLSMLREVEAIGGDRVVVRVSSTERFSESAREAEDDFGITPRAVQSTTGGKLAVEDIYLGAAFMCGLDKVVVPFFDLGLPVEYEVVRSIATVSQQKRKRIGVVATDARLYGGFDMQSMSNRPDEPIINELKKQYDTEQVSPTSPIAGDFDVLLVVQPSSLPQEQLENVIDAIRRGVPTAIFEDPLPVRDARVAGTSQPRLPASANPFMNRAPPEPKGDIRKLWDLLQVDFSDREIVRNTYNPHPKLPDLPPELVFIDRGSGAAQPFNAGDPITSGLQQILLMFGASLRPRAGSTLTFTPLLSTGPQSGIVAYDEILQRTMFGGGDLNPNRRHQATGLSYVMAARIQGTVPGDPPATINVVVSADIDMLYSVFFMLRERGSPGEQLEFNFDNVTYVLNVLDALAGDDRFMEIRKRRPAHRTLTAVEERTRGLIEEANREAENFRAEFDRKQAEQKQKLNDDLTKLQDRPGIDVKQMLLEVQAAAEANERKLQSITANLQRERDRAVEKTETRLAQELRRIQGQYKFTAVLLPPIPPLVLAVGVFAYRRRLERVGAAARRSRRGKEDR